MDEERRGRNNRDADADHLPGADEERLPATTAADVESAGRSCMAILLMSAVIALVILGWIVFRSFGGGQ